MITVRVERMMTRSARGGSSAVRWAHGVFLALCVALAVLVHHEMPAMDLLCVPDSAQTAHVTPRSPGNGASAVSDVSVHNAAADVCSMPGMQHCTTASVDSVQLAVPDRTTFDPLVNPRQAAAGRAPAAAVGRAPPDLLVLSQLRR
ncbi:hypothetical protein [Streptomyces hokutonensis]|uniref:hypothetical protein n=1 Tax=Streptomyces hokutonensis TaxID=1306990 RepID=UPI001FE0B520|nr:hypothetical protein [Streptomyces hokutonensis]